MIKILKILLLFVLLPIGCDDDDNPVVPISSECEQGLIENPNYQEGEAHQLCVPESFVYYISAQFSYYFIGSIYFDGNVISDNDWIASFNENVCVGAKLWGDCPEEDSHCELVGSGKDDSENTIGYLEDGDIPTFKVYIVSDGEYYDVSVFESVDSFIHFNTQIFNLSLVACSEGIPNSEGNCD